MALNPLIHFYFILGQQVPLQLAFLSFEGLAGELEHEVYVGVFTDWTHVSF